MSVLVTHLYSSGARAGKRERELMAPSRDSFAEGIYILFNKRFLKTARETLFFASKTRALIKRFGCSRFMGCLYLLAVCVFTR